MSPSDLGERLKPFVFLDGATFVLGSAVPHPYELHLGAYSVHTSEDALAAGGRNLRELKKRLDERGDRRTASGSTPLFRG